MSKRSPLPTVRLVLILAAVHFFFTIAVNLYCALWYMGKFAHGIMGGDYTPEDLPSSYKRLEFIGTVFQWPLFLSLSDWANISLLMTIVCVVANSAAISLLGVGVFLGFKQLFKRARSPVASFDKTASS